MKKDDMKKILVTGAVGQIGSELTLALRDKFGGDNVLASENNYTMDTSRTVGTGPARRL